MKEENWNIILEKVHQYESLVRFKLLNYCFNRLNDQLFRFKAQLGDLFIWIKWNPKNELLELELKPEDK